MEAAQYLDLRQLRNSRVYRARRCGPCGRSRCTRYTGKVLVAAALAMEYGFTDIDGKTPRPLALTDV
jgi:dehydrogenase/reductase SDR family member 1